MDQFEKSMIEVFVIFWAVYFGFTLIAGGANRLPLLILGLLSIPG